MPQPPKSAPASPRPRGVMLVSTACLLAAVTFCAGLFIGHLFSSVRNAAVPDRQAANAPLAAQSGDSGHSPEWLAHVEQARSAVEKDPRDAAAWAHLGNLYFDEQHIEEAVEAYEKSLALRMFSRISARCTALSANRRKPCFVLTQPLRRAPIIVTPVSTAA